MAIQVQQLYMEKAELYDIAVELLKQLIATPSFSKEEEKTAAILEQFFINQGIERGGVEDVVKLLRLNKHRIHEELTYIKDLQDLPEFGGVKNKKIRTNGTIDFINGQKGFLSKSIYNVVPKLKELIIFPNYLLHTAYPFNIEGERRSFSFNAKIILKK